MLKFNITIKYKNYKFLKSTTNCFKKKRQIAKLSSHVGTKL